LWIDHNFYKSYVIEHPVHKVHNAYKPFIVECPMHRDCSEVWSSSTMCS
jgi:hypothetical protein